MGLERLGRRHWKLVVHSSGHLSSDGVSRVLLRLNPLAPGIVASWPFREDGIL